MANPKTIENLQKDIKDVKAGIDDPNIPPDAIGSLKASLAIMEKKLAKMMGAEETPREKKEKPAKEQIKIGGKDINEMTAEECLSLYHKRRDQVKLLGKKFKSQSIISKLASDASAITEQAISAIPTSEIKDNPEKAAKAAVKIGEIMEQAFTKIREVLKPFVENADLKMSEEAKKDLESFEKFASEIKAKYSK